MDSFGDQPPRHFRKSRHMHSRPGRETYRLQTDKELQQTHGIRMLVETENALFPTHN